MEDDKIDEILGKEGFAGNPTGLVRDYAKKEGRRLEDQDESYMDSDITDTSIDAVNRDTWEIEFSWDGEELIFEQGSEEYEKQINYIERAIKKLDEEAIKKFIDKLANNAFEKVVRKIIERPNYRITKDEEKEEETIGEYDKSIEKIKEKWSKKIKDGKIEESYDDIFWDIVESINGSAKDLKGDIGFLEIGDGTITKLATIKKKLAKEVSKELKAKDSNALGEYGDN